MAMGAEKIPKLERPPVRVFGKLAEEDKAKLSQKIGRRFKEGKITEFSEKFIKEIENLEYDKRPYEVDFINESNRVLNEILEKCGIEPFDIPQKNIHIIPPEVYRKADSVEGATAVTNPLQQLSLLDASQYRSSPLATASTILHEMTHLKGFMSFDVEEFTPKDFSEKQNDDEPKYRKSPRRVGLVIYSSYRKADEGRFYESFIGLNEAVISEIEQRYRTRVAAASSSPEVKDELVWLDSSEEAIKLKEKIAQEKKLPVGNIFWVSKDGKSWRTKSYPNQRKVLDYITQEIGLDENQTKDEVLDLFIKAHFTGKVLTIAKLIEKTFGENSFFVLGGMSENIQSARRTLDYLKKQRRIVTQKKAA
jgi:hypothetical protein